MQSVRSRDTGPERVVRSLLHKLGYRFRLHRKDLPGTPDIVFPGKKKIIFIHGCFWHGHNCNKGRLPKSKIEFWSLKVARNQERDVQILSQLNSLGWKSMVVWQCELRDKDTLTKKLIDFLVL
jgi:DNA mismatch endonuclease, patch repair protein